MLDLLRKIFPSANQRRISEYTKIVKKINALEEEMSSKDENFFKELHFDEKPDEEKFSHIFASVREASVRTLGLRHFDCQMIGGLVLKDGNIAEMKTGEGKTLVATLPAVLNALNGKKVYVPPDAVETQNIEDDIKDAFNFDDDIKKKNKELENKKNKEISFNSIKNERNFEVEKKSKDVFIPLNDVINNSFTKQQNNSDASIALNSTDNNKDYASFENQFLNSIG